MLEEDSRRVCPVTVWFVHDPGEYEAALPSRRSLAARSRLWIVWQKGRRDGLNGNFVREARAGDGAGGLQDLFAGRGVERNGVRGEEGALAAFFEVAQARVEHFFHAAEFGAPEVAHVVEAAVDGVEAGIQMRGEQGGNNTEHGGVEQHRHANREIELLVGHHN